MKTNLLTTLLEMAGIMHLGLIAAGLLMPKVVHLHEHLAGLPPFIRRLYWVYYSFIGLCLVGFGLMSFFLASALASGALLARALCVFLTLFWTVRLIAATFIFDLRPYVKNGWLRLGYYLTNIVFIYLPVVYAVAAWEGGRP